jgi:hypothetical protein
MFGSPPVAKPYRVVRGYDPRLGSHTRRPSSVRQFRRAATRCTVARCPISSAPDRSSIVALGIVACATPLNATRVADAATVAARKRFCANMVISRSPARFVPRSEKATRGTSLGSAQAVQRERFNADPGRLSAMADSGLGARHFLRRLGAACAARGPGAARLEPASKNAISAKHLPASGARTVAPATPLPPHVRS